MNAVLFAYALAGLDFFLWASYFLTGTPGQFGMKPLARAVELLGANWIGTIFLPLVALLFVDVVSLVLFQSMALPIPSGKSKLVLTR